jgi:2-C-methyl-D-erythritol 2,4-cyclodiphosphate synthase
VLSHAITDAIIGAIAAGDIGMHFPDTDPRWKGAGSLQFLQHAVKLATDAGFTISNVDSTVILEKPKLKDFRLTIRESLAATIVRAAAGREPYLHAGLAALRELVWLRYMLAGLPFA